MIRVDSWPRAILHLDGDGFFASIEQAVHPELKGRPVVTGVERGIVAAASYEAKRYGVKRGVPLSEVKKICPDCVFLPSDYETYSLFSKKMFAVIGEFTPIMEEYSIDEAFADLTGLRRLHHGSYPLIAEKIKKEVERSLGITVSVGLSLSKSLAKLCSKFRKPSGFTAVPGRYIHLLLAKTGLEKVWGFGPNTTAYLTKLGMVTALDYVKAPLEFTKKRLGKVGLELWQELRGEYIYKVDPAPKAAYQSIGKSKTFLPASVDPSYLVAQLLRNLESACAKARRYDLAARRLVVYLRRQNDFGYTAIEATLSRPTAAILELAPIARDLLLGLLPPHAGLLYRATGVVLAGLQKAASLQFGLFEDTTRILKVEHASAAIDGINEQYGKQTIQLGDSLLLNRETKRQHLNLPVLAVKV